MSETSEHIVWRSPTDWSLSAPLYALEIRDRQSQDVFNYMYGEHGLVFRPLNTQGLNSVRISPNVLNREEEIARFFELTARL